MSWQMLMHNLQRTGSTPARFDPPFELAWKQNVGFWVWEQPVLTTTSVFVSHRDGFQALDIETGELRWITSAFTTAGQPGVTIWNNLLLVSAINGVHLLDLETGISHWHLPGNGICCPAPCVIGDTAILADCKGKVVFAVALPSGEVLWQFTCPDMFRIAPSVWDRLIVFAGERSLYALDHSTGTLEWQEQFHAYHREPGLESGNNHLHTFPIANDRVIVSIAARLFALDVWTGKVVWQAKPVRHTPCIADGIIYAGRRGDNLDRLYALALNTGLEIWRSNEEYTFMHSTPIAVGNHLHVGAARPQLGNGGQVGVYSFSRSDGRQVSFFPTESSVWATAAFANGYLVVGSHDWHLYCFRAGANEGSTAGAAQHGIAADT